MAYSRAYIKLSASQDSGQSAKHSRNHPLLSFSAFLKVPLQLWGLASKFHFPSILSPLFCFFKLSSHLQAGLDLRFSIEETPV